MIAARCACIDVGSELAACRVAHMLEQWQVTSMVDSYVLFAAIWGIGISSETNSRAQFGIFLRKLLAGQAANLFKTRTSGG